MIQQNTTSHTIYLFYFKIHFNSLTKLNKPKKQSNRKKEKERKKMLKVIDQQGIQNIIQYITTIQPILNQTKTELENYINFLKQGNYDLSSNGTVDDQINRFMQCLEFFSSRNPIGSHEN